MEATVVRLHVEGKMKEREREDREGA